MKLERWMRIGQRVVVAPAVGAAARSVVSHVPMHTLMRFGLGRRTTMSVVVPLAGAFTLGAVIGAGTLLFFAPGSDEMRKRIASRIDAARSRIRHEDELTDEERAAARAKAAAFATATRDHEDDGHRDDHDDHGRPRRRNTPRA
jgi:hypothetical protein